MSDSTTTTRRRLLKQGVVAATAAVAAPYFVPRGVLAAADQPGANDRIGLGGIGIGRQGSGVIRGGGKQVRVVAIADVDPRVRHAATMGSYYAKHAQVFAELLADLTDEAA